MVEGTNICLEDVELAQALLSQIMCPVESLSTAPTILEIYVLTERKKAFVSTRGALIDTVFVLHCQFCRPE